MERLKASLPPAAGVRGDLKAPTVASPSVTAPSVAAAASAVPAQRRSRQPGGWKRVADALQTDIIQGRLFPRERLIEDDIMQRFGTSRHAVRSAFDEMERRGLVVREANRGARVRHYSGREIAELFEVQETLEAQAIRRMPLPLPEAQLARLEEIQARHEAASRREDFIEVYRWNKAFHEALFDACGNAQLAAAIRSFALRIDPVRMRRIPDRQWREEAIRHHHEMIALLRRGDREALVALCAAHMLPTRQFYEELYAANADAAASAPGEQTPG
jgi:DNA-binding GntR family transcriptional regulator